MKKIILLFAGLAFLTFKNQAQTTVTDYDGNVYNTVTIGTQIWLKENLKVTHYSDGTAISNVKDSAQWINLTTGAAYCNYDNNTNNVTIYGRLYNWYAVDNNRNICPTGWHVPSDTEWTTLTDYLGGNNIAGGKMKETGTIHWCGVNIGADNSSGFTALPGGSREFNDGSFNYINRHALFWSSTWFFGPGGANAWSRRLNYYDSSVYRSNYGDDKKSGFSVRCVCDYLLGVNDINYKNNIQVYPNPAIDKVYINCAGRQNLNLQIYNVVGECVLQRELSSGTNDIDVSYLLKGIYVIKLTGTDWTVQRKFIKE